MIFNKNKRLQKEEALLVSRPDLVRDANFDSAYLYLPDPTLKQFEIPFKADTFGFDISKESSKLYRAINVIIGDGDANIELCDYLNAKKMDCAVTFDPRQHKNAIDFAFKLRLKLSDPPIVLYFSNFKIPNLEKYCKIENRNLFSSTKWNTPTTEYIKDYISEILNYITYYDANMIVLLDPVPLGLSVELYSKLTKELPVIYYSDVKNLYAPIYDDKFDRSLRKEVINYFELYYFPDAVLYPDIIKLEQEVLLNQLTNVYNVHFVQLFNLLSGQYITEKIRRDKKPTYITSNSWENPELKQENSQCNQAILNNITPLDWKDIVTIAIATDLSPISNIFAYFINLQDEIFMKLKEAVAQRESITMNVHSEIVSAMYSRFGEYIRGNRSTIKDYWKNTSD